MEAQPKVGENLDHTKHTTGSLIDWRGSFQSTSAGLSLMQQLGCPLFLVHSSALLCFFQVLGLFQPLLQLDSFETEAHESLSLIRT